MDIMIGKTLAVPLCAVAFFLLPSARKKPSEAPVSRDLELDSPPSAVCSPIPSLKQNVKATRVPQKPQNRIWFYFSDLLLLFLAYVHDFFFFLNPFCVAQQQFKQVFKVCI